MILTCLPTTEGTHIICLPTYLLHIVREERASGQTVDQNSITLVAACILKYECTFTHIYIYVANGENWKLNGFFFVSIYPVLFVFCLWQEIAFALDSHFTLWSSMVEKKIIKFTLPMHNIVVSRTRSKCTQLLYVAIYWRCQIAYVIYHYHIRYICYYIISYGLRYTACIHIFTCLFV